MDQANDACKTFQTITANEVADALLAGAVKPQLEMSCGKSPIRKADDAAGASTVKIINLRAGNNPLPFAVGSGFFNKTDDTILTNLHVVANTKTLTIEMENGERFKGRLVDLDEENDLAKIKVVGLVKDPSRPLPLADLSKATPDTPATIIGHPQGSDGNVFSEGKLLGRTTFYNALSHFSQDSYAQGYRRYLQAHPDRATDLDKATMSHRLVSDIPVWHGNSGGPAVDREGRVVGVAQAMDPATPGISLLVPADKVEAFANRRQAQFTFEYKNVSKFSADPVGMSVLDGAKLIGTAYLPKPAAVLWGYDSALKLADGISSLTDKSYRPTGELAKRTAEGAIGLAGSALVVAEKWRPLGYAMLGAKALWSVSHDFETSSYELKKVKRANGQKQEPFGWTDSPDEQIGKLPGDK